MSALKIFFVLGALSAILTPLVWKFGHKYFPAPELPKVGNLWWATEAEKDSVRDESIRPFKISVDDKVLQDLKVRLQSHRYTRPLENVDFEYGFDHDYLKEVIDYWLNQYDWRKQEKALNQFDGFKTKIDGIDVHFLHVKPKNVPKTTKVIPLMLVHGWPGSVYEFYKILPMLTTPSKDYSFVFEVICPHIPGYGFSEAPHRAGFGGKEAAHIFDKLMQRLGFSKYYAQGGDWGSLITSLMALYFPERVEGLHINMVGVSTDGQWLKILIAQLFPSLIFDEVDVPKIYPLKNLTLILLKEMGYMHLQATKPDTAGVGLNDSPAGLAAYILEKFSTWVNMDYINLPDGGLTKKLTMDELLTNVMIYWVSGSITSSMRFYKEFFRQYDLKLQNIPITVPTGIAAFPKELMALPKSLAEHQYFNIIHYTDMPRGGHFAAFEEPKMLADDFYSFVKKVQLLKNKKK